MGTGAAAQTVTVGSTNGASATTIDSGTGAINIGNGAQARTVRLGTGAAVQTVVIGENSNATSAVTINAGRTGNINLSGPLVVTPNSGIAVPVGGIAATDLTRGYLRISGSGGAIDITANPQVADGTDGQMITIECTSGANTVKFDDGNGLQLTSGVSFTMGANDILTLVYDGTDWIETGRRNN